MAKKQRKLQKDENGKPFPEIDVELHAEKEVANMTNSIIKELKDFNNPTHQILTLDEKVAETDISVFSHLAMYGLPFERYSNLLREGYTQVSYGGSNEEINGFRIVGIYAIYHPDGRVAVTQTVKDYNDIVTRRAKIERIFENEKEFDNHVSEYQIKMSKKSSLTGLIKHIFNYSHKRN